VLPHGLPAYVLANAAELARREQAP
jgi:hypothetical protein